MGSKIVAEAVVKQCGSRKEALKEMASRLIKIGAEMVMRKGMPPTCIDDLPFLDTATKKAKREVLLMNQKADEQSRQWAIKTREIADIAMVLASQEEK